MLAVVLDWQPSTHSVSSPVLGKVVWLVLWAGDLINRGGRAVTRNRQASCLTRATQTSGIHCAHAVSQLWLISAGDLSLHPHCERGTTVSPSYRRGNLGQLL